ncbi:MAG: integrase [Streptomyces oryziradicis]|jgi:hypothetical protein|nr:integrase [Actinacidiphila oryziradicis]
MSTVVSVPFGIREKGAPFARSSFGRKWRKAREKIGMPEGFRFYDLRHTGNTLAADTGAKTKDLMVRAGQSFERAQLIYQHSHKKHQRNLADGIDAEVRKQRREAAAKARNTQTGWGGARAPERGSSALPTEDSDVREA